VLRITALAVFIALLSPAAILNAEQLTAIVFPFDGPSKDSANSWLSEGIAISISAQLDSRELKAVDRSERIRLVESLDLPPGARLSRGSMIRAAERAVVDLVIMGAYSGTDRNMRVSVRVLDVRALKLSGEMVANGPVSALPQMENELAWLVLQNNGLEKNSSRQKFQERTRKVPNTAYSYYVQSLTAPAESEQLRFLLKAIEAFRDFPEAQFRLGSFYFRKGDCGSAIPHLLLGRSDPITQEEDDFMRGTCYLLADQTIQAIQTLWRLQSSRSYEALNNLGVAYLRKGDTALAQTSLMDAKNLSRTDATVSLNLGLARHLQGNDAAARPVLEDAARLHPKNGMLQFLLGIVLKGLGESDKASAATAKARSLGVNADKLQSEDPRSWSRLLSSFEH
jgi:tetratricopeptide (TPR) repeat protein